jgi:hypothetical protein
MALVHARSPHHAHNQISRFKPFDGFAQGLVADNQVGRNLQAASRTEMNISRDRSRALPVAAKNSERAEKVRQRAVRSGGADHRLSYRRSP